MSRSHYEERNLRSYPGIIREPVLGRRTDGKERTVIAPGVLSPYEFDRCLAYRVSQLQPTPKSSPTIPVPIPTTSNAPSNTPAEESPNELDVRLVMEQTHCTRERALVALERHKNDIVEAIIDVTVGQD